MTPHAIACVVERSIISPSSAISGEIGRSPEYVHSQAAFISPLAQRLRGPCRLSQPAAMSELSYMGFEGDTSMVGARLEETRRIGRILGTVQLIAVHPRRWQRRDLARRYEVGERQIQKDLTVIRHGLGLPLMRDEAGYIGRRSCSCYTGRWPNGDKCTSNTPWCRAGAR